jgi:hypothetical protein
MELIRFVNYLQKREKLLADIDKICDDCYRMHITLESIYTVKSKIYYVFRKYNMDSYVDKLDVNVSFDKDNCRFNMEIKQTPLIPYLHPAYIIE